MIVGLLMSMALAMSAPPTGRAAPTASAAPVNTQAGGPGGVGSAGPRPCPAPSGPVISTSTGDEAGTISGTVRCGGPRPGSNPLPQPPSPQPTQVIVPCPQPSGGSSIPQSHGDEAGTPHNPPGQGGGCARPGTVLGPPLVLH